MIGQALDLLADAASIDLFYRENDALMDVAASLAPQATVGDIVRESMLEGKLKIRKQLGGKYKFGRLQIVENSAELAVGKTAYFLQQREWNVGVR
jgi:hypothetical protein